MAKKKALNMEFIPDITRAAAALKELCGISRRLDGIKAEMNKKIDAAKSEELLKRMEALEAGIQAFALVRKEELFAGKKKSVETAFGSFGFRLNPPSLSLLKKWTWGRVLETLKDRGIVTCIRIKEEVDKEALEKLPEAGLEKLGVERTQEEVFFVKITDEEIRKEEAA